MFGICINNNYWFGTIGKSYEILDIKEKIIKDVGGWDGDFNFIAFTIKDDYDELVDISSDMFIFKEK